MARAVWWCLCIWTWATISAMSSHLVAGGGIKGEPRVTERWEKRRVMREKENVKLACPITASPEPLFEWFKDGEAVGATWERYATKKHSLRIRNAKITDSGEYTCRGVNGFGHVNASMQLIVLSKDEPQGDVSPPELVRVVPEGPQRKRIGESLTLTCKAIGLPTPTVTWHKDGVILGRIGESIFFNELQPTDAGIYTCRAVSDLGSKTANFSVNILESQHQPDLEISEAMNTTVIEGTTTSLQCTVSTSRTPTIQWLKEIHPESYEGGVIPNSSLKLSGRHFLTIEGARDVMDKGHDTYLSKLTIVNAMPRDAGVYVCLGTNDLGFSFMEARVTVIPTRDPPVGPKEKNINWFFLIIPAVVIIVVIVVAIMCQMRKTAPDKPVGVSPPTPVLKGDDTSALAPLNPDSHGHLARPPDIVYQKVGSYPGSTIRGGGGGRGGGGPHTNSYKDQYPSPYPDCYPDSYPEPAYSDPYSGERGPTRASEHSYARLTHPSHPSHPSLASHPSHTSHASSSPHLPPSYAQTHVHAHAHSHSHTHKHPQYFTHYNL